MMQNNFKVTVVFPCDFEDDESKENKKYDKSYLYELLDAKAYRYSSPIFSINHNIPKGAESSKSKRDVANEILSSCHLIKYKSIPFKDKFEVSNVLYPYGVCINAELNKDELENFVVCIEKRFTQFNKKKADEKRADDVVWIIYEKPIIIIELENESDIFEFPKGLMLEELQNIKCVPKIKASVSNEIVAIKIANNETLLWDSLYSVLAVLISLKNLSSNARTKSKILADDYGANENEKRNIVTEIYENCAVFEEIANKNIFYSKIEQALFEFLVTPMCIVEQEKQIHSARENADYLLDKSINKKAAKINTTAFITGYIGLILSFFALVPIQLRNIITTSQPLCTWQKVTLCVALIGIVVVICYALVSLYNKWESTKSYFKSLYTSLKKLVNKLSNKTSFILSALIILALVSAIIILGIFVFGGLFECV